jgi:hypothetical protein
MVKAPLVMRVAVGADWLTNCAAFSTSVGAKTMTVQPPAHPEGAAVPIKSKVSLPNLVPVREEELTVNTVAGPTLTAHRNVVPPVTSIVWNPIVTVTLRPVASALAGIDAVVAKLVEEVATVQPTTATEERQS